MLQPIPVFNEPHPPRATPWGPIQRKTREAFGIWSVTTAGHGGIWLSPEKNASVPSYMRDDDGWYEEDTAWAAAMLVHAEAFAPARCVVALDTLKTCWPDAYEQFTGKPVAPGESHVRDQETFWSRNPLAWVAASAWGDWAAWVDRGFVGVLARQGPPGSPSYEQGEARYFLIGEVEYRSGRGPAGFQIDLDRHPEIVAPSNPSALRSQAGPRLCSVTIQEDLP